MNIIQETAEVKPKSAWGKVANPAELYSLEDVMSEQLANHLNEKESPSIKEETLLISEPILSVPDPLVDEITNTDNDFLIAQLLQLEMDKQYDELLRKQEELKNKNSHVAISYHKFKSVHPIIEKDDKEKLKDIEVSTSEESEDEFPKLKFKRGVVGKGDQMVSKHDALLTSRHNGAKVMNFPPEFDTGDKHGLDLRLSNNVFNALKTHSVHLEKKSHRVRDKQDKSTNEISLDPKTRLILFKFVNADIIDSIGGIISTGKEATIFHAAGGKSQEILVPKDCAVKVFKTTLNEFKTREKYIADDYRFKDRYKHLNPQKIVKLWAEKEMHNLMKMRKFYIPCPDVILLKKHVLIMSLIGGDSKPAPKLKDANLTQEQLKIAYEHCIQIVEDLYTKCNLVHADFNQFNTLWHENQVWVIDVSQSVEPIHPMGLQFLLRDCTNIYKFFTNRKLENVLTGEEIFNKVTGMNFTGEGEYFLSQIQKFIKEKQNDTNVAKDEEDETEKKYNFDYHFKRSTLLKEDDESSGEEPDN